MKTSYLGLELAAPVIVSSSPYTATAAQVGECARHGAGAVVLKSIFEEQILHHAAALEPHSESAYGDAEIYLRRYLGDDYRARYLQLVRDARTEADLPVVASINCLADNGAWVEYAAAMADAGATAIELNLFFRPADPAEEGSRIESRYADVVARVTKAVRIPVAVKLPQRLTNVYHVADRLAANGARGVVLFNRFFEPDVDIERIAFVEGSPYSEPSEIRELLRTAALFTSLLPRLDLALTTGIHDGGAVVKSLLCGARAVEVCTAIHREGFGAIKRMNEFVDHWADRHGFGSVEEFRGRLNFRDDPAQLSQRVQYMRFFPSEEEGRHEL